MASQLPAAQAARARNRGDAAAQQNFRVNETAIKDFNASREGTVLANFNHLQLTEEEFIEAGFTSGNPGSLFKFSPVKLAKKAGDPKPTGQFAEISTQQLAQELLDREAGNPGLSALSGNDTGDIFGELRLRNTANQGPPAELPAGTAFRVEFLEQQANNLDRQRAGLSPLTSVAPRGAVERDIAEGILHPRDTLLSRGFRRANEGARNRSLGAATETTTDPEGEALRRANSQPIRTGSAARTSGGGAGGFLSRFTGR